MTPARPRCWIHRLWLRSTFLGSDAPVELRHPLTGWRTQLARERANPKRESHFRRNEMKRLLSLVLCLLLTTSSLLAAALGEPQAAQNQPPKTSAAFRLED